MATKLKRMLPTGGVNLVDAPTALKEDECQWAKNVWPTAPGTFSPRGALEHVWKTAFGWAGVQLDVFNAMRFGAEIPTVGALAVVVDFVSAGVPQYWLKTLNSERGDSPYSAQLSGVAGRGCFVDIGFGAVLFLDGVSGGWVVSDGTLDFHMWGNELVNAARMFGAPAKGVRAWGLLQSTEDGGYYVSTAGRMERADDPRHYEGGLPAGWRPRIAVMAHERLVYFNLADTHRDAMVWADKNNPGLLDVALQDEVWYANTTSLLDRDGPYTRLGADNQDITAALAIATSNEQNLVEQSILVWKRDRVYLVQGEPGQTHEFGTNPLGTLSVKELSVRAGCVGQQACCTTPYGVFWVGSDDVWFMAVGTLPVRVGTKISPRLKAQALSDAWKVQCVYASGRLIVTLMGQGGGDGTPACDEQWWLDLRRGPPQGWQDARWFGPQNFTTTVSDFAVYGIQFLLQDSKTDSVEALVPYQRTGDAAYYGSMYGHSDVAFCTLDGESGVDSPFRVASPSPRVPVTAYEASAKIEPPKHASGGGNYPVRLRATVGGDEYLHRVYTAVSGGTTAAACPDFGGGYITDSTVTWLRDDLSPVATARQLAANAVLLDVLSREETLGDAAALKNFDGIEVAHGLAHPLLLDLVSIGAGVNSMTGRQAQGASPAGGQLTAGAGRLNQVVLAANAVGARFVPAVADGGRCPGFSHAFRLKTRSAFVLERPYFFGFQDHNADASQGTALHAVVVPAGEYSDIPALMTAVNAAVLAELEAVVHSRPGWVHDAVFRIITMPPGAGSTNSPFALIDLTLTTLTSMGLGFHIPLSQRGGPIIPVTGLDFPAGPWVPPLAGYEAFDVYDDTTYLMSLFGFMVGPTMAENVRYVEVGFAVGDPMYSTYANTPYAGPRAYSRFGLYELNARFRTFTKRPT